jgi:hypothetical protein
MKKGCIFVTTAINMQKKFEKIIYYLDVTCLFAILTLQFQNK